MQIRLKVKLALAFLLVTLIMVGFVSGLANYFLANQFQAYAINKKNQKISDVIELMSSRYADWGNQWDVNGVENIGINNLGEGLLLRLKDNDGAVLWDARVHNNGMCTTMLTTYAETMQTQNSNFQGGYTEQTYSLTLNGQQIGSLDIGYYGPYFYTDADVQFLNTLNKLLILAAVISMIVSVVLGVIMARQLTLPITRIIETTRKIAGGKYIDRITEHSSTLEISELTTSVNSLAETLRSQEELRKQLTSNVAHELRTPIAILQSHLEAMIDGTWQTDITRLENCHDEVVRISKLVGDLEKLTLLEQDNLILNVEQIDIDTMIKRIVSNFRRDFQAKNVELTLTSGTGYLMADEDKLSQVFINLIANALKYTNSGGKVDISTAVVGSDIEVTISDTGIGISAEDLPFIFERFYRTDKSRSRETGGSGIGLTIAKAIIDAHKGKITVRSTPDEGSRFIVTLPKG